MYNSGSKCASNFKTILAQSMRTQWSIIQGVSVQIISKQQEHDAQGALSLWIVLLSLSLLCMMQNKRRANRGKKKTGKIQHLNGHSKINYPLRTRAFITCTTSTCTNNGAENVKNGFLLFHLVAFIVHASKFCPCFSQKQSAERPKQIQGND